MSVFAWSVWCTLAMCLLKPLSFFSLFSMKVEAAQDASPPTLCQPAALGFSPAEPTMSSQHSHPSFGNIHSMADQQQVPETCFLAIKFYDITHVQSIIVVWLDINSRSYENMFCPHHILFKNCSWIHCEHCLKTCWERPQMKMTWVWLLNHCIYITTSDYRKQYMVLFQ